VASKENEDPILLVLVLVPPLLRFEFVDLFCHDVGGKEARDSRPPDGRRGRAGRAGISSLNSSRSSCSDSIKAPELYDLESGWRREIIDAIVLIDDADDRRERLIVDRRRVRGDGASSSSL